ncbi:hypothetical protein EV385_1402 [Krasilnikovia cinnamomea]|uniref:Uncharacterized protein n=1 Tax=Krasilnikovia cinnamomea TaxID=349313 RepID=A0A4Q7ZHT1_9ACTN|nr:hypothetical protein EV385_1402 [Krasilnikovia cinnamomea]
MARPVRWGVESGLAGWAAGPGTAGRECQPGPASGGDRWPLGTSVSRREERPRPRAVRRSGAARPPEVALPLRAGRALRTGRALQAGPALRAGQPVAAGPALPAGQPQAAGPALRAGQPQAAGPALPAGQPQAAGPALPAGQPQAAGPALPAGQPVAAGPALPAARALQAGRLARSGRPPGSVRVLPTARGKRPERLWGEVPRPHRSRATAVGASDRQRTPRQTPSHSETRARRRSARWVRRPPGGDRTRPEHRGSRLSRRSRLPVSHDQRRPAKIHFGPLGRWHRSRCGPGADSPRQPEISGGASVYPGRWRPICPLATDRACRSCVIPCRHSTRCSLPVRRGSCPDHRLRSAARRPAR